MLLEPLQSAIQGARECCTWRTLLRQSEGQFTLVASKIESAAPDIKSDCRAVPTERPLRKAKSTDIPRILVPTRAIVSLLGWRRNKHGPLRMPWGSKAEDCPPRGAGTGRFAFIKTQLCRRCR